MLHNVKDDCRMHAFWPSIRQEPKCIMHKATMMLCHASRDALTVATVEQSSSSQEDQEATAGTETGNIAIRHIPQDTNLSIAVSHKVVVT